MRQGYLPLVSSYPFRAFCPSISAEIRGIIHTISMLSFGLNIRVQNGHELTLDRADVSTYPILNAPSIIESTRPEIAPTHCPIRYCLRVRLEVLPKTSQKDKKPRKKRLAPIAKAASKRRAP
jgi:hypothetical protein